MLLFSTIVFCFIFWRAIWVLPCRWPWKAGGGLLLFLSSYKFHILHIFGGPMYFAPVLPRAVLITGTILFTVVFISFFLLLAAEIIRLAWRLICRVQHKALPKWWKSCQNWSNLAILAAAIILTTAGLYNGSAAPEVKRFTPEFAAKNSSPNGRMRIVFITDLHVCHQSKPDCLDSLVKQINDLKPDLVLMGGDYVDGSVAECGSKMLPLQELRSTYGVFGVPGNHEYYSGYDQWIDFLEKQCNVRILANSNVILPAGIAVAGLADPAGYRRKGEVPDLDKALHGIPRDMPVILLAHQPRLAHQVSASGRVKLQLSGHTHGGMIRGVDLFVAAANAGMVSGSYLLNGMEVYISNGTGIWQGFPVRLGRNAEITLIEI